MGVYHTARRLIEIVHRHAGYQSDGRLKEQAAVAAALVHDLGHGPFSHAFETLGKEFGWPLVADHVAHSDALIRSRDKEDSIGSIFDGFSPGFQHLVADMVRGNSYGVHGSVVSSQFDADRLDYVRRDRLMCGTRLAAIDFEWLIANLEVAVVPGDDPVRPSTFVLGPKAVHAAEGFVTGLFQMYPSVYFHKTTRGAEKLMQALLIRAAEMSINGTPRQRPLPQEHPLTRLFRKGDRLEILAQLDDAVIFGALPMLRDARDPLISDLAGRLADRKLFKCFDLSARVLSGLSDPDARDQNGVRLRRQTRMIRKIEEWSNEIGRSGRILVDDVSRAAYKPIETEGPVNQIWIKQGIEMVSLADLSPAVAAIRTFHAFRAYHREEDQEAKTFISDAMDQVIREEQA